MASWLEEWPSVPCDGPEAFRRFDALEAVEPDELMGRWRGRSCPTGHPLDGLLEALGWYGKAFAPPDRAHPLLFERGAGGPVAIDPRFLPARLALRWPALAHSQPVRAAFAALRPLLVTTRPAAVLRRATYRGVASTAMVYRHKPITDHFRRAATDRVLGVMAMRGARPFFFLLVRDRPPSVPAGRRLE